MFTSTKQLLKKRRKKGFIFKQMSNQDNQPELSTFFVLKSSSWCHSHSGVLKSISCRKTCINPLATEELIFKSNIRLQWLTLWEIFINPVNFKWITRCTSISGIRARVPHGGQAGAWWSRCCLSSRHQRLVSTSCAWMPSAAIGMPVPSSRLTEHKS